MALERLHSFPCKNFCISTHLVGTTSLQVRTEELNLALIPRFSAYFTTDKRPYNCIRQLLTFLVSPSRLCFTSDLMFELSSEVKLKLCSAPNIGPHVTQPQLPQANSTFPSFNISKHHRQQVNRTTYIFLRHNIKASANWFRDGTRDPHSIRRPPSRIATKDLELDSARPTTRNRQPLLESSSYPPYQSRISIHSLEALRAAAPSASGARQTHEWAQMREGIH